MTHQYGYAGKILRADLSSGTMLNIPTKDYADKFLGGRGIAAKIYWDEVPPGVSAFDPENRLLFMTGPLAGFPVVGGSRWQVCSKSPATTPEQFSYCNLGGYWGAQLKFAGYDGLVVQGKSDKPVYLFVDNGIAEIRDAAALWGKTSIEAREILKAELGRSVRVVACGPAGENMVPFANVIADNDASGCGGFGAVMGSKGLKAVAVRGKGKVAAADPDRFLELCKYVRDVKKSFYADSLAYKDSASTFLSKMKRDICYGCIGPCVRATYEAEDGTKGKFMCGALTFYLERARRYYGEWTDVPFFAAKLCDGYGLDIDVVSSLIMWLSKCYKAGVLTDGNTGIPLSKLGSLEFIDALVKKISHREGFGDVLAQGLDRAAVLVGKGTKEFITGYTSKDGKLSTHCPRVYLICGLFYAMEPRPPVHQLHEISIAMFHWLDWARKVEGAYLTSEVLNKIAKRFWGSKLAADFSTYDGKALAATKIQDREYIKESLILCDWIWPITSSRYSEDHVGDPTIESKLLSAVTGKEIGEEELYKVGERIFNLQRALLVKGGHRGRKDDKLPEIFYTVPLKAITGAENSECLVPGKDGAVVSRMGAVVDREKFEQMREEFYQLRGWDIATGLQTKAKLNELGLKDVARDLAQKGLVV